MLDKCRESVSLKLSNEAVKLYGVPLGSKVYYQCDTLIILRDTLIILRGTLFFPVIFSRSILVLALNLPALMFKIETDNKHNCEIKDLFFSRTSNRSHNTFKAKLLIRSRLKKYFT